MTHKTLEYYMSLPYRMEIYPEEDGSGFTAAIPDLPGCLTSAPTLEELWDMIAEAKSLWLEVALEDGDYVPEPAPVEPEAYSGRFVVRLPRGLHRQLARRAGQEGASLNTTVVSLLAEGMGRWSARGVAEQRTIGQLETAEQPPFDHPWVARAPEEAASAASRVKTLGDASVPYRGDGRHRISLEFQFDGETEWHQVAAIPLAIASEPVAGDEGQGETPS